MSDMRIASIECIVCARIKVEIEIETNKERVKKRTVDNDS